MKGKMIIALVMVSFMPALFLLVKHRSFPKQNDTTQPTADEKPDSVVTVNVKFDDGIRCISLEEYIVNVVLAEMPVSFDLEALKAQAVVARTYTNYRMKKPKHEDAAVCTDHTCCQAYISIDDYLRYGGTQQGVEKVNHAVMDTNGEVLTFQGSLIEATYFSCSGGRTEDAVAVWGTQVPYLQSVESPNEENATHYMDTISMTATDFCEKLNIRHDDREIPTIGEITYTQGGGVAKIQISGKTYSGTKIRSLLGLYSTSFVITVVGDQVIITTKGFGHRVGMSQYGADAMAVRGADYKQILSHYYRGIELQMMYS